MAEELFDFGSLVGRVEDLEPKLTIPTPPKKEIIEEEKPEVPKKLKKTYVRKTPEIKLLIKRIEQLEKEREKRSEIYSYTADISLQTIKDYLYDKYDLKQFDKLVRCEASKSKGKMCHYFWWADNYRNEPIFQNSVEKMRVARLLNRFERGDGKKYSRVLDIVRSGLTKILKK